MIDFLHKGAKCIFDTFNNGHPKQTKEWTIVEVRSQKRRVKPLIEFKNGTKIVQKRSQSGPN